MLTTVNVTAIQEVTGDDRATLALPMNGVGSEYQVRGIEGLGPTKHDVGTLDTSTRPGGVFLSSRGLMRNIVLTLGYSPDYAADSTVTDLRASLYSTFRPGQHVRMSFVTTHLGTMEIVGVVETFEPSIFSSDPEVVVSIICPDPLFDKVGQSQIQVDLHDPTVGRFTVDIGDTAPVGFYLGMQMTTATSGQNPDIRWVPSSGNPWIGETPYLYFDSTTAGLIAGDGVWINTIDGEKDCQYHHDLAYHNGIPYLSGSLERMKLHPGLNDLLFTNYTYWTNVYLLYTPRWEMI